MNKPTATERRGYNVTMPTEYPRRPPRLRTVFQNQRPFYFVTFNTYKRRSILASDNIHQKWLEFTSCSPEHDAWVGRYVIMPDHVHLFVWIGERMTLEKWIPSLKAVLGKELLRLGHDKPHWQEGFFDHLLRSDESYGEKWEYVRHNPVRKGLCASPEDWPYQGELTQIEW
jgi:putative transposase